MNEETAFKLRFQLMRHGIYYTSYGDSEQEIIDRETNFFNRPWWWLRLCGWSIGEEVFFGSIIQHPPKAPVHNKRKGK